MPVPPTQLLLLARGGGCHRDPQDCLCRLGRDFAAVPVLQTGMASACASFNRRAESRYNKSEM